LDDIPAWNAPEALRNFRMSNVNQDQDMDEEPRLPWFQQPLGRGVINGVLLFCLLYATQHYGLVEPGPPVTQDSMIRFATFGVVMGLIMYFWTARRIKRDRARRDAERLARLRAEAYDAEEGGGASNGSEKDGSER
jgi:hypothetical protein